MLTVDSAPVASPEPMLDDSAAVTAALPRRRRITARAVWLEVWPKVAAVAIGLAIWQLVVWSGWRREYVLPPPATVFRRLGELIADGTVATALVTTLERAAYGFTLALAIGVVVGSLVSSSRVVRSAVGSFITGLQTMPSIAWFPLA
ncbi:MAG TPA: hypothetical protein VES40_17245, partial [Ilumatobacteraceae bacterium]|nr:hypothetical protein [Ilumatobacteraceae bacterium]